MSRTFDTPEHNTEYVVLTTWVSGHTVTVGSDRAVLSGIMQIVASAVHLCAYLVFSRCEGCLVVRSGHGPQAEVAQGVGPEPLVEH